MARKRDKSEVTTFAQNAHFLPVGFEIGPYRVEHVLGQGGFGITYAARVGDSGEQVAIKEFFIAQDSRRTADFRVVPASEGTVLNREIREKLRARFESEAMKIIHTLGHPNVVRGREFLVQNDVPYFVMDYVEGVTLATWFDDKRAATGLPPREEDIQAVMDGVLDAIGYLHSVDELHRDLKPQNILVKADGTPVVIDFGASRTGLGASNDTSVLLHSDGYSPPEIISNDGRTALGAASDIYSIGAILYRIVTGESPMGAIHRLAGRRFEADMRDPLSSLAEDPALRHHYSVRFLKEIGAALSLDERARPQSVAELRDRLGWGAQPRAQEPPVTAGSRRRFMAAAVVVAASLASGFVLSGHGQDLMDSIKIRLSLAATPVDPSAVVRQGALEPREHEVAGPLVPAEEHKSVSNLAADAVPNVPDPPPVAPPIGGVTESAPPSTDPPPAAEPARAEPPDAATGSATPDPPQPAEIGRGSAGSERPSGAPPVAQDREGLGTNVASLDPIPAAPDQNRALAPAGIADLRIKVARELRRLGCMAGSGDGDVDAPSVARALEKYRKALRSPATGDPDPGVLDDLVSRSGRVCPPTCGAREIERDGACVAKTCPSGQRLTPKGECEARTVKRPLVAEKIPPKRTIGSNAPSQSCFTFSGRRYCE
ncbi:serine/threonine protein kinase [Prosthecomicrobium sp. N25]|uniref:serine/threonine protein kinase n=1 Tax=Prosthecomicrobium sp. N25 TaxID=3129254 RepID=UPI0030774E29